MHALVIGGSMSGLFAGLLLRRAGVSAEIYERVEVELTGRGAGIVTQPELQAVLVNAGCDLRDLGVEVRSRRTLDRSGRVLGEYVCPQMVTSWDRVFRLLRAQFPDAHYHRGKELVSIEEQSSGVTAHFADGSRDEGDLLVGADGFRSSVRGLIAPATRPVYAGYVGWRGLAEEAALSGATHAAIFDAMVFALPPNEQFISYPIAGANDELTPGHLRCNFVWYRPAAEGELRLMLTDGSGRIHPLGIPPPLIRPEVTAALREAARALIAPPLEEVVRLAPQPFLQPIFDVESERMAAGRVALVGDAAFLGRPHVAAGVTKAAEDAAALAQALAAHGDVAPALAAFERARIPADRRIMVRGRELGGYLRRTYASEAERETAERHHTPEAVMREIAVLDF
jgi:2-polyprenyl-6-methoxyphenol hydroxylase-like FAD-dependent oxidoreductase